MFRIRHRNEEKNVPRGQKGCEYFMLNEMIEAVKTAEKKAAGRIEEAGRAAARTAEAAQRQAERMRAEVTDDAKAYSAGIERSIKLEEEKLLREAEAKAENTAALLREKAAEKQAELDKMLIDVLFS